MVGKVDIIDVMIAVHTGELRVAIHNGFFMLENIKSGERVRLNESGVVRCKECIHRVKGTYAKCTGRKPDDFCSDGERRTYGET